MGNTMHWAAVALLTTATVAQTTFTAPSGFDVRSGNHYAYHIGLTVAASAYTNVRYQAVDPTLPAGKITLTRMEMRTQTFFSYADFRGMGRTILGLRLQLGNAAKTISKTFSSNWAGQPTRVLTAGKVSLPSHIAGKPKQVWGNAGSFPFTTAFAWDSSKGRLLQEWTYAGAKLANGSPRFSNYFVDGHWIPATGRPSVLRAPGINQGDRFLPAITPSTTCRDPAVTGTMAPAQAYINLYVYADNHENQAAAGRWAIGNAQTMYTAPGGAIVGLLSLGGSDQGVNIGAGCNRLYANPSRPLAIYAQVASKFKFATTNWFANTPRNKWNNAWAGQVVYWQAAWENSRTRRLSLTVASRLTLPKKPAYTPTPGKGTYVYEYHQGTTRYGPFGPATNTIYNPIERWTKK